MCSWRERESLECRHAGDLNYRMCKEWAGVRRFWVGCGCANLPTVSYVSKYVCPIHATLMGITITICETLTALCFPIHTSDPRSMILNCFFLFPETRIYCRNHALGLLPWCLCCLHCRGVVDVTLKRAPRSHPTEERACWKPAHWRPTPLRPRL